MQCLSQPTKQTVPILQANPQDVIAAKGKETTQERKDYNFIYKIAIYIRSIYFINIHFYKYIFYYRLNLLPFIFRLSTNKAVQGRQN